MTDYPNTQLLIDGEWRGGAEGRTIDVLDPATDEVIGTVAHATKVDLDAALEAAKAGFATWSAVSAYERAKIMRKAADNLRANADAIARMMTFEQGKPLAEAKGETL
ncbi:MAG: aldehyde dehydrogenase family protein, partial [Pseudomonadota bacterium]|nr:aldehyde dehydrogenase family protein [Pseudomonadota bacterium]